jgi:hypothetical protein
MWWHTPVIPTPQQQAEVGVLQYKNGLGKSARPYLKNKLKVKGLGAWLKCYRVCLAITRPCLVKKKSIKM